jgi:uncharacterized protein YdeI (BOF family)
MRKLHHWSICAALLALSVVVPACAGTITVCQCNIYVGGRYTEQDTSAVTYDTAKRFAQWVASINPSGGTNPPIAVIGMQELISETDRAKIEQLLEQYTGADWAGSRTPQGVNNASGIGFFWRTDLVEHRLSEWYLGEKVLETIDNGYVLKYAGRLFRKLGTDEAFGLFTGKLLWGGAILNGHEVTEEERRQEAIRLKEWIVNGQAGSPGMSGFPGTARVITNDLNTDTGTSTWNEMDLEFTDPSSQHTHNSFSGQTMMDWFGKRLDYVWWDYDSGVKQSGGFAANPARSSHFGSDHRAVYATINLHAVDLTPPAVSITAPAVGALVTGPVTVTADATDASGIHNVEFYVDGQLLWTDTAAPYSFTCNPAGLAIGVHTITARATDASSNRLKSVSPPVAVYYGPDGSSPTIGEARLNPNGTAVILSGKVVTAVFSGAFYVAEGDRSSAIKVNSGAIVAVGDRVNIAGTLSTLNGERDISSASVTVTGTSSVPLPLGLSNERLGGEAFGGYTPGVQGGVGLNNIGHLVRTWGRVKASISGFYLYIDDGSALVDGYGYTGLRVDVSGLSGWSAPAVGRAVQVTGVISTATIAGKVQRRLRVRSAADIVTLD